MYKVNVLDLSAAFDKTVVEPGTRIVEVFCLDVPGGATFLLKLGDNREYMTITKSFSMEPRGDYDANKGLFVKNVTLQPLTLVELIVVYGDGKTSLSPIV